MSTPQKAAKPVTKPSPKPAPQPTDKPSAPDMAKEHRKEIRALDIQIRKGKADQARHLKQVARDIARIEINAVRTMRKLKRESLLIDNGTRKQLAAFTKRRDILIGRLS